MNLPPILLLCLLPCATLALYDESSTRKINLEDIEDDHIKNERQAKQMPPPLSKQPAKGHPVQLYPPTSNEDYPMPNLYDAAAHHHYSTRAHHHEAHHHVQPLTDQPTVPAPIVPPEAGYQHSPVYHHHGEDIMYVPVAGGDAGGDAGDGHGPQQFYDVGHQQPGPHFYYSHDVPQQQLIGNGHDGHEQPHEYQIQFVPIEQHGGSDEQQHQQESYHGPSQEAVPSTTASSQPVSYSHDVAYGNVGSAQPEPQHHHHQQQQEEPFQYPIGNGIPEPHYPQNVYGLPPDVLFQSQKDIEYAKPSPEYGLPPLQYYQKEQYSQRDFSQDSTSPKPSPTPEPSYQVKSIDYQDSSSQLDSSPSNFYQSSKTPQDNDLSYGYKNKISEATAKATSYYLHQNNFKYQEKAQESKTPAPSLNDDSENYPPPSAPSDTQSYYLNHLKEIKSYHHSDNAQKPPILYGPPDNIGKAPQIEYGVPNAPFRKPVAESNQDLYAPRRPSSSSTSERSGKSFAVSFPYPPSFVTITTTEKSTPTTEKSKPSHDLSTDNEINPWRPIISPKFRSYDPVSDFKANHYQQPIPDIFHYRQAKSLLDSYIPSWVVRRMQEQHLLGGQQGHQPEQVQQQVYSIAAPQAIAAPHTKEDSLYNTISYSSNENIYGNHFKRSVPKKKSQKQAKPSDKEMTAVE